MSTTPQNAAIGPTAEPVPEARQPPSRVRYGVVGLSVTMAVLLYLDRMAISVPVRAIAHDLGLEISQVGDSVAVFFWCYALLQVPAGWLGDRYGGRRVLTLYVVAWSLATMGLGLAGGLASLLLMRSLLGIAQAGAYATTASYLQHWIPLGRRGVANSAVALGGRAGNVAAPVLTAVLMGVLADWGFADGRWRVVFFAYGLVGLVWAVFFWRWFRDRPEQHSGCNAAERALITGGADVAATGAVSNGPAVAGSIPWRALLTNRSLQMLALASFCVNVGWVLVGTWLPTFLIQAYDQTETEAGLAASLTAAAGMAGCLCGGIATDWLVKRVGLAWGRRLPAVTAFTVAALIYALCTVTEDVRHLTGLLVVASFLGDFALGPLWATLQDIGGPYAGTVLGWSNMCGNLGAALAISWIGRLVDEARWVAILELSVGAYLLAALAWLAVDARSKLRHKPTWG